MNSSCRIPVHIGITHILGGKNKTVIMAQLLLRQKAKILWSTLHGICLLQQSGKLNVSEPDPAEDLLTHFLDQFLQ